MLCAAAHSDASQPMKSSSPKPGASRSGRGMVAWRTTSDVGRRRRQRRWARTFRSVRSASRWSLPRTDAWSRSFEARTANAFELRGVGHGPAAVVGVSDERCSATSGTRPGRGHVSGHGNRIRPPPDTSRGHRCEPCVRTSVEPTGLVRTWTGAGSPTLDRAHGPVAQPVPLRGSGLDAPCCRGRPSTRRRVARGARGALPRPAFNQATRAEAVPVAPGLRVLACRPAPRGRSVGTAPGFRRRVWGPAFRLR